MKHWPLSLCLCLLLLVVIHPHAGAQNRHFFNVGGKMIRTDTFDAAVNRLMGRAGVPGMSLAIIRDNKIVYYNTYGYKTITGRERVDKETIFEACSLSKNFLAFAVYQLVDKGMLDLDKPMYQYLEYEPLKHDDRYRLITPRMVLSHSSGIENLKWFNNPDTLEIISNPGEKYVYSGEGYNYLALVVEKLLHKPYKEYIDEMVFAPLQLKRTFSMYSADGKYPANYATGHDFFGKEVEIWKNTGTVPASGIHVTALDYATLITAIFDGKHLSAGMRKQILSPVIRLDRNDSSMYYGPGFELLYYGNDTIVSHGGSNPGFKNLLYYSVVKKCGIVMLTNGDWGKSMAAELCRMSVSFDIGPYTRLYDYGQYPSDAIHLFEVYRQKGADAMFAEIDSMALKRQAGIAPRDLDELGYIFFFRDKKIARSLAEANIRLNPGSAVAYYILGNIQMEEKQYRPAYDNLVKARKMALEEDDLEYGIQKCARELSIQPAAQSYQK